jgi:hypothetical protein
MHLKKLVSVFFLFFLLGCTTMESRSFVSEEDLPQASILVCEDKGGWDGSLQISHLDGEDIGKNGKAWPSKIYISAGEHVITLRHKVNGLISPVANAIVSEQSKKHDSEFTVDVEKGRTYHARFNNLVESTGFGPKRLGVEMWIEDDAGYKVSKSLKILKK